MSPFCVPGRKRKISPSAEAWYRDRALRDIADTELPVALSDLPLLSGATHPKTNTAISVDFPCAVWAEKRFRTFPLNSSDTS